MSAFFVVFFLILKKPDLPICNNKIIGRIKIWWILLVKYMKAFRQSYNHDQHTDKICLVNRTKNLALNVFGVWHFRMFPCYQVSYCNQFNTLIYDNL